jgi:FlaA1/EpsC-like NDP-sugar epimerase
VGKLTLFSLTESGLYNINRKLRALRTDTEIVPVLGSVTDEGLVNEVLKTPQIVIHAAAHKHVPLCQDNPVAAIMNNVLGTETLLKACVSQGVEQFLLVSTDKAVKPTSVMGATKRVAELMTMRYAQRHLRQSFLVTRFGNVMDSDGSVLPLWREQIAKGGPITVTDPNCTRFFMTIPDACELIMQTLGMEYQSGVFVFDMGEPKNMYKLAQALILASGMECPIDIIGLRPGENLTEELFHGGELVATPHPKIFEVRDAPSLLPLRHLDELLNAAMCRLKSTSTKMLMQMVHE